ncbi:MAG: D-2-hydroxyacid dehydrogenase [Erysipelotrichaceae bacterium]|nr:D-2-hydroxyacid dehydrogenase [Erysipelotrichaceae bacterium]
MRNILVTMELTPQQQKLFQNSNDNYHFIQQKDLAEKHVADAHVIIGNVPHNMLDHVKNLQYLHLSIAGSDQVANHPLIKDKITLTNSTGCYGMGISEHMLASVLFFYKRFNQHYHNQQNAVWDSEGENRSIFGSKVLVLGLGDIGNNFAQRMHLLNAEVKGIKRTPGVKPAYLRSLHQMDAIDDLIKDADIIACSLPNTKETHHIINKHRLGLMKDDALLINVGRGSAIDTQALIAHLRNKPMFCAALDVFEEEPLPKDNPLWQMANVQITPHVSGRRNLAYTREKLVDLALSNLNAFLNDNPLRNVVDFNTGYRR